MGTSSAAPASAPSSLRPVPATVVMVPGAAAAPGGTTQRTETRRQRTSIASRLMAQRHLLDRSAHPERVLAPRREPVLAPMETPDEGLPPAGADPARPIDLHPVAGEV